MLYLHHTWRWEGRSGDREGLRRKNVFIHLWTTLFREIKWHYLWASTKKKKKNASEQSADCHSFFRGSERWENLAHSHRRLSPWFSINRLSQHLFLSKYFTTINAFITAAVLRGEGVTHATRTPTPQTEKQTQGLLLPLKRNPQSELDVWREPEFPKDRSKNFIWIKDASDSLEFRGCTRF